MKYFAMVGISANLRNKIIVIEINIATTIPKPAFNPKICITNENPSSEVEGTVKSDNDNLPGKANLTTFATALKENRNNKTIETNLACFFKLGNLCLIPLPKINPCKIPIHKT